MASWRDDEGVAAWSAFLRAHAAVVRNLERDLGSRSGLPLSWYDVLLELDMADERRLRMGDLGERAVLSRTRVSRVVDELEQAGYVRRAPDPDDRRSSYAEITADGRKAFRRAAPLYLRAVHEHFADLLTPAQRRAVLEAMQTVIEAQS